jgi:hypothetical protein
LFKISRDKKMYKKLFVGIIIMFFLSIFIQENLKAQFTSCADTCLFESKPLLSYPLECCPNCIVTVDYATGDCNGFCSIKINSVKLNGTGCP